MKLFLFFLLLISNEIAYTQSYKTCKDLTPLVDDRADEQYDNLEKSGFSSLALGVCDWYFSNDNTSEEIYLNLYSRIAIYSTESRIDYLGILESMLQSSFKQVDKPLEVSELGFSANTVYYKGSGYLFAMEQIRSDSTESYSFIFGTITSVSKYNELAKRIDAGDIKPSTEKKSSTNPKTPVTKERKERDWEDILNREAIRFFAITIGVGLPRPHFSDVAISANSISEPYKSGRNFGGKPSFHVGYAGIYSPEGLNSNFTSKFDLSIRWGLEYNAFAFDLNKATNTGTSYEYTSFGSVLGGAGPALTFSNTENNFSVSFFYLPSIAYYFGGTVTAKNEDFSESMGRSESAKHVGYRGTLGVDFNLGGLYLGVALAKIVDHSTWEYKYQYFPTDFSSTETITSNLEMKQITLKIGYVFQD